MAEARGRWTNTFSSTVYLRTALLALYLAGVLDLFLTALGLRVGAITEANPLMAGVLALGTNWAWGVKLAVLVGGLGTLAWCAPRAPGLVRAAVWLLVAGHGLVLAMHIRWLTLWTPLP